MWRIMGLVPVCLDESCGTPTTSLVKIIRKEKIGDITYDAETSGYTGKWGSNTLYSLLNEAYYGKINANDTDLEISKYCYGNYTSTYQPVPNCDYTNKGISSDPADYYGRMVKEVYWNTGSSNYTGTTHSVYKTETKIQTVKGKIGIMSASDYGYAGLEYTTKIGSSTFANYTVSNWLFSQGNEWTNTQYSSTSSNVLMINAYGEILSGSAYAYMSNSIRPVLYLDENVYIISGDGTESNPYVLGM